MPTNEQTNSGPEIFEVAALLKTIKSNESKAYLEFIRNKALSVGIYRLAAGEVDRQKPHTEDEIYYVLSGQAQMQIADRQHEVRPGQVILVEANMPHRFHTITQDLTLLVFFAPAEAMP